MHFQVVLPCEHEKAGLLRVELLASDTSSIEGGPPFSAEPHGWGIAMSVSGEFQRARSQRRWTGHRPTKACPEAIYFAANSLEPFEQAVNSIEQYGTSAGGSTVRPRPWW